jgi:hypothetical protein
MASGTKVAELYAELGIDSSKLQTGLKESESKLKKMGSTLNDSVQGLTGLNVAALAGAGGIVMLGKVLGDSIQEAADAQKGQAQLAAVLKSTGGASGMTADAINEMANSMGRLNAMDNDEIVSASNVLLTFTNIGKQAFPTATQAALDLSAAMGQDLQSSIVQIGKALNDPITGMTALQRVGVTFSQTQKDQIKNLQAENDLFGAQQIILSELNKEFGGSAAAAADTYAGKVKKLDLAWKNFEETIGNGVLPVMSDLLDAFNNGIDRTDLLAKASQFSGLKLQYLSREMQDAKIEAYQYAIGLTQLNSSQDLGAVSSDKLTVAVRSTRTAVQEAAIGWAAIPTNIQAYILATDEATRKTAEMKLVTDGSAFSLSQVDEKAAYAANSLNNIKQAWLDGDETWNVAMQKTQAVRDFLAGITSKEVTIGVNIEMRGYSGQGGSQDDFVNDYSGNFNGGQGLDIQKTGAYDPGKAARDLEKSKSYRPGKAGGGPVGSGNMYLVGERGPELFRPGVNGTIIPNNQITNHMGGITVNIYGPANGNDVVNKLKAAFGGAYQGM